MSSLTDQSSLVQPHPLIDQYFQAFNRGDYPAVVALFAEDGVMNPPFEEPIQGKNAILSYLQREATGMKATPLETTCESLAAGSYQIQVKGKVKAIIFNVNVGWTFVMSAHDQIQQVEVKLLASLEELLTLRSGNQA